MKLGCTITSMLVEKLLPFFEAQPEGYDRPATFFLTINRTQPAGRWSACYQDYTTMHTLLPINHCDTLDEVAIRLSGRLKRYMRVHSPKIPILRYTQKIGTVGSTNLREDIPMSEAEPTNQGMSFSDALDALKEGKRVARTGWNGRGLYVAAEFPHEDSNMGNPYLYIDAKALGGECNPWVPSQTDLFGTDWELLRPSE